MAHRAGSAVNENWMGHSYDLLYVQVNDLLLRKRKKQYVSDQNHAGKHPGGAKVMNCKDAGIEPEKLTKKLSLFVLLPFGVPGKRSMRLENGDPLPTGWYGLAGDPGITALLWLNNFRKV